MSRVALCLEYDGSAFEGWQTQPHRRTVQDTLEGALSRLAGHRVQTVSAGRTDSGVHGMAQIVHFDTEARRPLTAWVRGVNSCLPKSVAVRWAVEVPADFHARFSALTRSYRYVLLNQPTRPAIFSGRVGWFHVPLDVTKMGVAAALLVGEQDFSAFRSAECQARSPVRTLRRAQIRRHGDYVVFDFQANGFLHHMVRNLVGALLFVGKGKTSPGWVTEVLASRDRTRAAPTFQPDGLYLCGVDYAPHWLLPEGGRIIALPPIPGIGF
ncbi:MAG: tRNA pseudouridine(38-40) synthase TruA [Zoogloeaceae bacterium]|nr:tRNA pseudouridine(38-40) synthase TruA [Zoogloeaceae bacterium]